MQWLCHEIVYLSNFTVIVNQKDVVLEIKCANIDTSFVSKKVSLAQFFKQNFNVSAFQWQLIIVAVEEIFIQIASFD